MRYERNAAFLRNLVVGNYPALEHIIGKHRLQPQSREIAFLHIAHFEYLLDKFIQPTAVATERLDVRFELLLLLLICVLLQDVAHRHNHCQGRTQLVGNVCKKLQTIDVKPLLLILIQGRLHLAVLALHHFVIAHQNYRDDDDKQQRIAHHRPRTGVPRMIYDNRQNALDARLSCRICTAAHPQPIFAGRQVLE